MNSAAPASRETAVVALNDATGFGQSVARRERHGVANSGPRHERLRTDIGVARPAGRAAYRHPVRRRPWKE